MKPDRLSTINCISGGIELLSDIKSLWQELNRHHVSVSQHFSDDFSTITFERREAKLKEEYQQGNLRIDIALDQDCPIGYIIAGVRDDHVGEIESIFIIKAYRGMGIGGKLMTRCIGWMKSSNIDSIFVKVAAGNENVYPFYAKYGFFPRVITLKQKQSPTDWF